MSGSQSDHLRIYRIFRASGPSDKFALILSIWFGSGLLPGAPGTFGTVATLPLILWFNRFEIILRLLSVAIVIAFAFWASGRTRDLLGNDDPPVVVIDEAAGFLLTMLLLPPDWLSICLGFIMFRFFDILKPYPIKKVESIGYGFGIVLDDMVAGLYASATTWIVLCFIQMLI